MKYIETRCYSSEALLAYFFYLEVYDKVDALRSFLHTICRERSSTLQIIKQINNNATLARDGNGNEIIVWGPLCRYYSALIDCHMNAFRYFEGYLEEILYDNIKQVVMKQADSQMNKQFEDFAGFYGFKPILCRPYRGQSKGNNKNDIKNNS